MTTDPTTNQGHADPFAGYTWRDDRGVEVMNVSAARTIAAARVAAARAEAWDEGYETCLNDTEARSAPPGSNGPVDPTSNPYDAALRAAMSREDA